MTDRLILTEAEMAEYRDQVADIPGAIAVFDTLEDCEGDLEDAAISVALQVGQEPDHSDGWLGDTAKGWRHILCDAMVRKELEQGAIANPVATLVERTPLPARLAILVVIYVAKGDVPAFCKAFEPVNSAEMS
jgi:hypothetical protein